MKKIKFLLVFGILIGLFSCAKEQTDLNANSIVTENGQISKKLVNDPLFENFDKAYYEMSQDLLKYSGEIIDREKSKKLNEDYKAGKFKTVQEFVIAKEKIGFTDFYKRTKTRLYALKTREDLYVKYPELKTLPLKTFLKFYHENRKYKLSSIDYNIHLDKIKEERKQESLK